MTYQHCKCMLDIEYPVTRNLPKTIAFANRVAMILLSLITQNHIHYINLWCRGSSGSIIAAFVSHDMIKRSKNIQVRICHVKKEGENSHSSSPSTFQNDLDTWNVIVDDFIATGDTIKEIIRAMEKETYKPDVLCVTQKVCMWKFPSNSIKYFICAKVAEKRQVRRMPW